MSKKRFEMFKTLKEEGMGKGLWLSRAMLENHKACITLTNRSMDGVLFKVVFLK